MDSKSRMLNTEYIFSAIPRFTASRYADMDSFHICRPLMKVEDCMQHTVQGLIQGLSHLKDWDVFSSAVQYSAVQCSVVHT
jgi:hypothetical protein